MSDLVIDLSTPISEQQNEDNVIPCDFSTSVVFVESGVPVVRTGRQQRDSYSNTRFISPLHRIRKTRNKPIKQTRAEFFLSHIPMGGEGQIQGMKSNSEIYDSNNESVLSVPADIVEVSGKQNYVYVSAQKLSEPETILDSGLYVFSPNKSFPMALTSIVGIDDNVEVDGIVTGEDQSDDRMLLYAKMNNVRRNKDPDHVLNESYRELLTPFVKYDKNNIYLDNAYIQQSSQTSMLYFSSWTSSIIPYIKETQLKIELNEIFRKTYPDVPRSFTLSKLRKLKHLSLFLCVPTIVFPSIHLSLKNRETVDYDIGTLALAFCYFERITLNGHVSKENRKLVLADCHLIAYKFNQLCEMPLFIENLAYRLLLEELSILFSVDTDKIISMEREVLVALEFSLLMPYDQYIEHIYWILRKLDTNLQTYLGEEMYASYYKCHHYDDLCEDGNELEGEENYDDFKDGGKDMTDNDLASEVLLETCDECDECDTEKERDNDEILI